MNATRMVLRYLASTTRIAVSLVFAVVFTRIFAVEAGRVDGVSMEPAYVDEELFFVNKFSLLFSEPYRGEVVQCRDPRSGTLVIKRVVGLPGEHVSVKNGRVRITDGYGIEYDLYEPYLERGTETLSTTRQDAEYPVLGPNEYFVLGDNRSDSIDSRHFGPVARNRIVGTVITRF